MTFDAVNKSRREKRVLNRARLLQIIQDAGADGIESVALYEAYGSRGSQFYEMLGELVDAGHVKRIMGNRFGLTRYVFLNNATVVKELIHSLPREFFFPPKAEPT